MRPILQSMQTPTKRFKSYFSTLSISVLKAARKTTWFPDVIRVSITGLELLRSAIESKRLKMENTLNYYVMGTFRLYRIDFMGFASSVIVYKLSQSDLKMVLGFSTRHSVPNLAGTPSINSRFLIDIPHRLLHTERTNNERNTFSLS